MEPGELSYGVVYVHGSDFNSTLMQSLQFHPALRGFELDWMADDGVPQPTLVARRMNVGNLSHAAVVRMRLDTGAGHKSSSSLLLHAALQHFADALTDVAATDRGDLDLGCGIVHECVCASKTLDTSILESRLMPQPSMAPRGKAWLKRGMERWQSAELNGCECLGSNEVSSSDSLVVEEDFGYCAPRECDPLGAQEELETLDIEAAKQDAFDQLKRAVLNYVIVHKKDPTQLIQDFIQGKYVIGRDGLSPLVVNGDLEIVLPGYDEVRVRMPALCRALYILFLLHRHDGIVLKRFADYRKQFEHIYAVVMPGRDERRAAEAIDNLCNPLSNTLQEYLSRIKRCFATVLADGNLLARYTISGQRGGAYRIQLPDELVTLPRAVTA